MIASNSPKVLMFGWEFPPYNSGGLGVACEGLSKALSASGVDLTFALPFQIPVTPSWCKFAFPSSKNNILNKEDISSMFAGYGSNNKLKNNTPEFRKASKSLMDRVLAYEIDGAYIASQNKHSIIHAHDWLTYPAALSAKRISGKPLIAHVHATEFDRSGGDSVNREIYNIEKSTLRVADKIVTVSSRTKDIVSNKYGIQKDKIHVVYNGVDFTEQKKVNDVRDIINKGDNGIVLFVGRITFQKGPEYFVNMAEKVLSKRPNTLFVISGSGDMEDYMVRLVAEKGLSSKFIFCGFLRGEELTRVYNSADIFVMPSVSEPFGIVPLEAMCANVPVLVSKESGVSEIISHALKSHFWDIDDMADKVVGVLNYKNLKNKLSTEGNKEVRNIHWKKAADSLISVYNSLDNAFSMFLLSSSPTISVKEIPSI